MKADGKEKIRILADFNKTFTYANFKGKRNPSLISQLRNGNYLTKDYAEKANLLYDKYHPIEISTTISQKEKEEKMKEWWSTHYKLLADSGLDEATIKKAVKDMIKEGRIRLRLGSKEFIHELDKNSIPLVIISAAGTGNMIQEFLKEQNSLLSNVHILGNILEFSRGGKFTGIKNNKVIHVLNKREVELKELPIYSQLEKRKSIILLGDSIDDLQIAENSKYDNLISIIFLENSELLELAKQKFDVIITNDGDFGHVNELLREIIQF